MDANLPLLGVDGCRAGWVAARLDPQRRCLHFAHYPRIEQLPPALACAVDIPIGLRSDASPRECDLAARRLLGRQASSIFLAPSQEIVAFESHAAANAESRRRCGKGVSLQAFHLFAKIREVAAALRPEMFEAHPELAFVQRAGNQLPRKSTAEGYEARRALLSRWNGIPPRAEAQRLFRGAQADDVMDAAVMADVAWRFWRGEARSVGPAEGSRIWF